MNKMNAIYVKLDKLSNAFLSHVISTTQNRSQSVNTMHMLRNRRNCANAKMKEVKHCILHFEHL